MGLHGFATRGAREYDGLSTTSTTYTLRDNDRAEVQFQDPGVQTTTWSANPTGFQIDDGDNQTFNLRARLSNQPRGTVTLRLNLPSGRGLTVDNATQTFAPENYSSTQFVTFVITQTAKDDDSYADEFPLDFTVTGYGSGTVADWTLTQNDMDAISSEVDPATDVTPLEGTEGGSTLAYRIKLSSRPSTNMGRPGTVSVRVTSNNSDVTVSPNPVVINQSNWEAGVEVTVTLGQDADGVDDSATLTHTATSGSSGSRGDYHAVSIPTTQIQITDDDTPELLVTDTTVVADAHSLTFAEGRTKGYRIKLATEPTDTVTVEIRSDNTDVTLEPARLTFNSSNYTTNQTVTVRGFDDDDTVDDTATLTHTVTQSGGSMEYAGKNDPSIAVTVTDPDKARMVIVTQPALSVTEGQPTGDTAHSVALTHFPATGEDITMTVTITGEDPIPTLSASPSNRLVNGNEIVFTSSNAKTPVHLTFTSAEDDDLANEAYTITHSIAGVDAVTGTDATGTRTLNVVDNDSANADITTSAVSVDEGSTASYDIKLTQEPNATVSVVVTVSAPAVAKITDGTCSGALTNTASLSFTTTTWNSYQSVTVCGVADHDAADDSTTLTYNFSGAEYNNLTVAPTTVTVVDDDRETITISPTLVDITEGEGIVATETYNVSLSAAPSGGNVTVTFASSNDDVTTNPARLVFSPGDWDSTVSLSSPTVTKSVEIRVADDDGADNEVASITNTQSGVSYGVATSLESVTVNITDSDERGVTITAADPFAVDEGGTATYTVVLDTEPTGTVTVAVNDIDADDDVSLDQTALEFTIDNWDTAQTVRVSADEDDDGQDDPATIEHAVSGADYGDNNVTADDLVVTVTDDETASVILKIGNAEAPATPAFSMGEASQSEYEIKLATRPINTDGTDGEVTVTVTTSNSAELKVLDLTGAAQLVDSYDVTFDVDNWNVYQTVHIAALNEPGNSEDDSVTILHAVSGADYGSVTAADIAVTIRDDDDPSFSTSAPDDGLVITEGTIGTYAVKLDRFPVGGDVTITITSVSNPDIRLLDADNQPVTSLALTFTTANWTVYQTVSVDVLEDRDARVDTGSLTHVSTGANYDQAPNVTVAVRVIETTLAGVTVEPTMLTVTEGRSGTYRVALVSQPENAVTVTVASSNSSKARVTPARLTFTSTNWGDPQAVTVTGVSDPDGNNETATIDHVPSGDIYDDLPVESVEVLVVEDGSSIRDSSSFLQSSSCQGEVRLTWNTPTSEGVTVGSFQIQWRSGTEQYSTDRLVSDVLPGETSYTLGSLTNGVTYTIRILALDDSTPPGPVWSRETSATPSATSCISGVSFGNILADSAPVIVELNDPEPDTMVNVRHRSLNPGDWSAIQSKPVPPGESSVVFDIRGLNPERMYEVQAWIGNRTPPAPNRPGPTAVAQKLFTTTALPEGVTIFSSGGGGGGGPVARIERIEPSIRSVTLSGGDEVLLSVEVWGRQGLHDNGLADKAPADGRPAIAWSSSGSGEFIEARMRSDWRDGVANDREVRFMAPSEPGTETITASLVDATECLSQQEDETPNEHEARCSAQIDVTVVRRVTAPIIVTAPVNPPGVIPETLTDKDGTAYAVFTPEDGGSFSGEGYSLTAAAGAVPNGEYIGFSMAPVGDASNIGIRWHRFTFAGQSYSIKAVYANGDTVSSYALNETVTACVPLPAELRGNISDMVLVASNDADGVTVLSSSVKIRSDGVALCGKLSALPVTVAAGISGPPREAEDSIEEVAVEDEMLPDTGGVSLAPRWIVWLALTSAIMMLMGLSAVRWSRRRNRSVGSIV